MRCEAYRDAIGDAGRGMTAGEGTDAWVAAHVASCAACAAALRVESALTADLRALREATADAAPSPALEAALLRAFAERHASAVAAPVVQGPSLVRPQSRVWFAVAASVALIAGAAMLSRAPRALSSAGAGVAPVEGVVPRTTAEAVPVVAPPVAPGVEAVANDAASTPTPARRRRRPAASSTAAMTPAPGLGGFVELPGAAALPLFESGTIVRVELALESLPAYGVAIAPDTATNPVAADLLVGQDGQARAIRLVAIAAESRGRQ